MSEEDRNRDATISKGMDELRQLRRTHELYPLTAINRDTVPCTVYQEVTIRKVTNGFIIHVGCKTFVSTRWGEVALGLGEYWTDPVAAERKYIVHENSIKMGKEIADGCPF